MNLSKINPGDEIHFSLGQVAIVNRCNFVGKMDNSEVNLNFTIKGKSKSISLIFYADSGQVISGTNRIIKIISN